MRANNVEKSGENQGYIQNFHTPFYEKAAGYTFQFVIIGCMFPDRNHYLLAGQKACRKASFYKAITCREKWQTICAYKVTHTGTCIKRDTPLSADAPLPD